VLATGVIAGAGLKPQDRRHGPATPATPVKDSGGGTGWTVLLFQALVVQPVTATVNISLPEAADRNSLSTFWTRGPLPGKVTPGLVRR